jgi:ribonuclease P protein component
VVIKNTFNHNEKLKSKKLIDLLFKQGKSFHCFPYRVVYLFNDASFKIPTYKDFVENYPIKFGVSVSKKNFKKAVDRNRVKRITREAWRLQKLDCYKIAVEKNVQLGIFFMYTQKELEPYDIVEKAMSKAIKKLIQIIIEADAALQTPQIAL